MSKKDLIKNPLDDYDEGPSVLDKASALFADQINNHLERINKVAKQVEESSGSTLNDLVEQIDTHLEEKLNTETEEVKKSISVMSATTQPNPFRGECPDFELTPIKQAIMSQQWEFCKDRWDTVPSSVYHSSDLQLQEALFTTALRMVEDMSVEHFVGVQPIEEEYSQIYYLQVKHADENNLSLEIVKSVVEAVTRKLRTNWTMEAAQDLRFLHGDDFMREASKILAQEISMEIYGEIYTRLYGTSYHTEEEFDVDEATAVLLYREANEIARRSRRGVGNKAIVSNSVAASLIRTNGLAIEDVPEKRYGHVNYVGMVGSMELFVDANMKLGDSIIIYKGVNETDAAMFYCPYRMIASSGMQVSPTTFQPSISLYSQYALHDAECEVDGTYENALSNYVGRLTINNLNYSIQDDKILTELFAKKPLRTALVSANSFYNGIPQ